MRHLYVKAFNRSASVQKRGNGEKSLICIESKITKNRSYVFIYSISHSYFITSFQHSPTDLCIILLAFLYRSSSIVRTWKFTDPCSRSPITFQFSFSFSILFKSGTTGFNSKAWLCQISVYLLRVSIQLLNEKSLSMFIFYPQCYIQKREPFFTNPGHMLRSHFQSIRATSSGWKRRWINTPLPQLRKEESTPQETR